ncbi:MAG: glycosyltransferase family 4 protein [Phycisphaerales bacterium]
MGSAPNPGRGRPGSPDGPRDDRGTILVLSQVYVPDPASVGQHMADAAAEMRRRGFAVRVLASARGYDDPTKKYAPREVRDGVNIRRLPLSSFGKGSIPIRLLGQSLFLAQALVRGLFTRGLGGILVSTSPPMCSIVAVIIGAVRRVPVTYWLMDLNPDQMIALGKIKEGSAAARGFEFINRLVLGRARAVVALDRFMAARVLRKLDIRDRLEVMPPWPHEDQLEPIGHEENPFRALHGLAGKFVVMYSGNHGPSNPISTAIEAARRLRERPDIVFMFIGGGLQKREVEAAIAGGASNIVSLPYQPLTEIRHSLSAADLHLVTVGNEIVGIVHPCKVYGAMAVGRPVLLLGPRPSHVADLLERHDFGWQVNHGDAEGMVRTIERAAATGRAAREVMGRRGRELIQRELSKRALCARFGDIVEHGPAAPSGERGHALVEAGVQA